MAFVGSDIKMGINTELRPSHVPLRGVPCVGGCSGCFIGSSGDTSKAGECT